MNRIQSSYPRMIAVAAVFCIFAAIIAGCEWGDKTDGTFESPIIIAPTSARLDASSQQSVDFVASGGVGDFSWTVSDGSLGAIYPAGTNAAYLSETNSGVNIVTVSDSDGNTASATVTQL